MERCNYNVKYTDFIRALRHKALKAGTEIHYNHGGTPHAVMHMMSHKEIKQNRINWIPNDIKIHERSDTAFFTGCAPYFDVLLNNLEINTVEGIKGALKLLNHADIPFTVLPNERCCGRDLILLGDTEGFLALARANMQEFNRRGIENIITSCPECYYTLKVDYPKFLDKWDINVVHITEKLAPLLESGQIKLGNLKQKVTFQDPCTLGRYSRIFDEPRDILKSIGDLEIAEMDNNQETALCCGASPWAHCGSVNKLIQKERLAQAGATGASLLVTACPKCQIHFKCAQNNTADSDVSQIEICDLYELAAKSLSPEEVS
jgi:Fe-S oxidoreductase